MVPAEAELPQSVLSSSGISCFPLCPARGRGGSEPPSVCPGTGVSPQGQAGSWGTPHQHWGLRTGVPDLAGRSRGGDTFGCRREQRGSQGSVSGSWWCRGPPQCPGRVSGGPSSQWDPHWMQTHFPPAPQARKNPSSSSSGVWLPPGTGRSPRHSALPRFGYLLRGCFRTAWTGRGDNGAAPAPNPALFGPRKIPIFLPQEPLGWGAGGG